MQATAETLEENMLLMSLGKTAPARAVREGVSPTLSESSLKTWEKRREKFGPSGFPPRGFKGEDGVMYPSRKKYNQHMGAVKRWNNLPQEKRDAIVNKLKAARLAKEAKEKKLLVPLAGKIPTSWLE